MNEYYGKILLMQSSTKQISENVVKIFKNYRGKFLRILNEFKKKYFKR